jgi:enoyl-CoA hydratase/carnithine racemase
MYKTLRIEQRDRIAVLYFNRPEKLNAINREVYAELGHYLDAVTKGDALADILVLTGEGRAFVAGADIDDYLTMTLAEFSAFQRLGHSVMTRMGRLARPVIAAVNGYALGGGFELALACDIVLAAENAKFGLPEAKLVLLPGGGGTQRLTRLVGTHIAKRMIFSGEMIDARRAFDLNIVCEIAPKGGVVDAAVALAETILANGPLAVRLAKRLIDEGLEASLPAALSLEMDATAHLFVTDDGRDGVAAFAARRPPRFTGK